MKGRLAEQRGTPIRHLENSYGPVGSLGADKPNSLSPFSLTRVLVEIEWGEAFNR